MKQLDLEIYFKLGESVLYEELSGLKEESFHPDTTLVLIYNKDIFNSEDEPGIVLSKTIKYLAELDIPFYFVRLQTSYNNIKSDISSLRKMHSPYENDINILTSNKKFDKVLEKNNSICVLPWIHFHINQQGMIMACCESNPSVPLGNLKDIPMEDIPNSTSFKKLRSQMLNSEKPSHCQTCWDKEKQNLKSSRLNLNERFKKHAHLIKNTNPDGSINDFKLIYADFRDNNLCNLKCRTCTGRYSSSIAQEEYKIWGDRKYIELSNDLLTKDSILDYISNNVTTLEAIYFAGGEPLLLDSHYKILDMLISKNPLCEIVYNTNLTELTFKGKHVIEYWKKLPNITVCASIDSSNDKAKYLRHGSDYALLQQNYLKIKDYVKFKITSVLSLYNIFDLSIVQSDWANLGVPLDNIQFTPLISPDFLSIQVLPLPFKELAKTHIEQHILNLRTRKIPSEKLENQWLNAIKYMFAENRSFLLQKFFDVNDVKDKFRHEILEEVYPEFKTLRSYVQNKSTIS